MSRRCGFSLLELLIVVFIISVLSGLSLPRIKNTFQKFELQNFAKNLYYLCHYLRDSSISQRAIYYLSIDKEKKEFQALYKQESGFKNLSGRFGKKYPAPQGVNISIDPPDKSGVWFYPDGSIDKIIILFDGLKQDKASLIIKGAAGEIQIQ